MWTFTPIYKCSLWGGTRLPSFKDDHNPQIPAGPIGESWEISDLEGNVSMVDSGPDAGLSLNDLIRRHGESLLGRSVMQKFGDRFPLMVKLIDAAADLSVQVHPDDRMAREMGRPSGKNEMWLVLDAQPEARIANGFRRAVRPDELKGLIKTGEIVNTLRFTKVCAGNTFFIPAGRVHAIGQGTLTAEIQQTSDDTFRLFDYNRTDADGNPRQLHIELASKALNYDDTEGHPLNYECKPNDRANILTTSFFTVNMVCCERDIIEDFSDLDSFVIIMAVEGEAMLETSVGRMNLKKGHTVLLAATEKVLKISPAPKSEFKAIEVFIS